MNILYFILFAAFAASLVPLLRASRARACNATNGVGGGSVSRTADAAHDSTDIVVKEGATAGTGYAVGTASARPLGVVSDAVPTAEVGDARAVRLFGLYPEPLEVLANSTIAVGDLVFTAATGGVTTLSATAATYYQVGVALRAATSGNKVLINHCFPVATVVS